MKRFHKWITVISIAVVLMTLMIISASASRYEPDGQSVDEYCYDASDCNRQLVVNCVDESGNLIKQVIYHTKRGEDRVDGFWICGYDLIAFDSNQGLWETCKLTGTSGTGLCYGAYIQIQYEFISPLSKNVMTATATVRRYDDVEVVTRHYVQKRDKYYTWSVWYTLESSSSQVVTYYDYVSTSKKYIAGYHLKDGYESSISGNLTYDWEGEYKNTPSNPRFFQYDLYQTNFRYNYDSLSSYDENTHGKLDYCLNRVFYIDYYYDLNEYDIKFDANGGVGAPKTLLKCYGCDITIPDTVPTREGYTFLGWGTYKSDTTPNYQPGEIYTGNSTRTLYAVWQENVLAPLTYLVQYNANGGVGEPDAQIKVHDIVLQLSSEQPTRSGYTFCGWSTLSTSNDILYYPGEEYIDNTAITLYAVWSIYEAPVSQYEIKYHANGGSGAPETQYKTMNVPLTLSTVVPTRSGYTFLGWSTNSMAASPMYYVGGSYTADASAMLYAVWSENVLAIYTLSFDANGGSGAPSSMVKTKGVTLYLPSSAPFRTNYVFLGWSLSSTATTPSYYAGGSFTRNADTLLYAVWEYSPETYRVYYNANGGSNAPDSQVKTYGIDLALSEGSPTRNGYAFLGWSMSNSGTTVAYVPGDIYTANASVTLYAVWMENNYDFSISNLTISNSVPCKYDQTTVKVRADSWDQVNAYSNISIQLLYDGEVISTEYVNFEAYGYADLTFVLHVGGATGIKHIEARINWDDHYAETDAANNSASCSINVQDYQYELSIENVPMADNYCAGMTVVTSFTINNDSEYDITPDKNVEATFTSYYYDGLQRIVVASDVWSNVVIPTLGTNLIYFKWTVPADIVQKTVCCECMISTDDSLNEQNTDNNISTFSTTIVSMKNSQTIDTRFESEAPSSYQNVSAPSVSTDKATWTMWEYENGSFVLKRYGVQISSALPVVAPSSDCVTAVYENGKWRMRSGYGITMSYAPSISTVSGYNHPDSNAYTSVQYVVATFPEFRYYDTNGNCRTLQHVNGNYQFVENPDADGNARVHFIPVYVRDGNYTVSVTATHVWTPAGMIEATRSANVIIIDGTIYDDWYQG